MVADRLITEDENPFICDGCLDDVLGDRKCAVCQQVTWGGQKAARQNTTPGSRR